MQRFSRRHPEDFPNKVEDGASVSGRLTARHSQREAALSEWSAAAERSMPNSALCVCVCVVYLITWIHHEAPASFSPGEQSALQMQDEAIHPGAVVSGKQRGATRAARRLADFTLRRSIVRNPPDQTACYEDKR